MGPVRELQPFKNWEDTPKRTRKKLTTHDQVWRAKTAVESVKCLEKNKEID